MVLHLFQGQCGVCQLVGMHRPAPFESLNPRQLVADQMSSKVARSSELRLALKSVGSNLRRKE
jgi:hypothetical protein